MPFEDEGRNHSDVSTSQGTPKITIKPPEGRERTQDRLPSELMKAQIVSREDKMGY